MNSLKKFIYSIISKKILFGTRQFEWFKTVELTVSISQLKFIFKKSL